VDSGAGIWGQESTRFKGPHVGVDEVACVKEDAVISPSRPAESCAESKEVEGVGSGPSVFVRDEADASFAGVVVQTLERDRWAGGGASQLENVAGIAASSQTARRASPCLTGSVPDCNTSGRWTVNRFDFERLSNGDLTPHDPIPYT
jgi:hypothetical protein